MLLEQKWRSSAEPLDSNFHQTKQRDTSTTQIQSNLMENTFTFLHMHIAKDSQKL